MTARNHAVKTRFSKEELERLKRKAQTVGLTMSAYLRFIALYARHEEEIVRGN